MTQVTEATAVAIAPELNDETRINFSGIEPSASEEIKLSYTPYFAKMTEIKNEAKKINFDNPTEVDQMIARELRLRMVKVRTGSEDLKNKRKSKFALMASVEQAAYNLVAASCRLEEDAFMRVEKDSEIKEKARKEQIKKERDELLAPFKFDPGQAKIEDLTEMAFELLLSGLKQKKTESEQAAAKAEESRLEAEARVRRKMDRIGELSNLGAKVVGDVVELKHKSEPTYTNQLTTGELETMTDEKYKLFFAEFKATSDSNDEYEKTMQAENERLKNEQAEQQKKQDRYNDRIAKLTATGANIKGNDIYLRDEARDKYYSTSLTEVMDFTDEQFASDLNFYNEAQSNNAALLAEAEKNRKKEEELKQRAAEAREKRTTERLSQLTNMGGRVGNGEVELKEIGSDKTLGVTIENIKTMSDEQFNSSLANFQSVKDQNDKQLDLEKEAKKAEEEKSAKEKADKKAEEDRLAEENRKAQLAPDKDKLLKFVEDIRALTLPTMGTQQYQDILNQVDIMIGKMVVYAKDKIGQIK